MDFDWNGEEHQKFVTNVGLVTSEGPHGKNVMAAEWTYLTSFAPATIVVSIGPHKATAENIRETKKFGVSIAAEDQNWISSIAGGSTGKKFDKVSALQEMGVQFKTGEKTGMLLVEGASLHAECELMQTIDLGDRQLFIGKILSASTSEKNPIAYHQGKYWKMDTQVEKPTQEKRAEMRAIVEKHAKH